MTDRTSRYPVVIHCTRDVSTPNSSMRAGNVIFIAVSMTTPEKERSPVAIKEQIRGPSIFLSKVFCPDAGASSLMMIQSFHPAV